CPGCDSSVQTEFLHAIFQLRKKQFYFRERRYMRGVPAPRRKLHRIRYQDSLEFSELSGFRSTLPQSTKYAEASQAPCAVRRKRSRLQRDYTDRQACQTSPPRGEAEHLRKILRRQIA